MLLLITWVGVVVVVVVIVFIVIIVYIDEARIVVLVVAVVAVVVVVIVVVVVVVVVESLGHTTYLLLAFRINVSPTFPIPASSCLRRLLLFANGLRKAEQFESIARTPQCALHWLPVTFLSSFLSIVLLRSTASSLCTVAAYVFPRPSSNCAAKTSIMVF